MSFLNIDDAEELDLEAELESLVENDNKATPNPELNTPTPVATRDIDTSTVYKGDSTSTPTAGSVVSVEGTKWDTTFFTQYLAPDDSPRTLDLGLDRTLQQYVRILGLDVYIQGDLEFSRDPETGISTLSGVGRIYPGFTPQPKDHFVGTLEDGKRVLMYIPEVRPLTYKDGTAHEFDFKLFDYANDAYLNNLDIKTIQTKVYSEDAARCGNGLVDQETIENAKSAEELLMELVDLYYDQFYNKEVETFALSHEGGLMYDDAVTEFFVRMVGKEWRGQHPRAHNYTVESTEHRDKIETIWDVLISGARIWRNRVNRTFQIRPVSEYRSPYLYNHLSHSKFEWVIAPSKKDSVENPGSAEESQDFYVFSEGFYDQDLTRMDKFESYLLGSMTGGPISLDTIIELIDDMQSKDVNKQFYEIPALIWHLVKVIRS